MGRFNLKVDGSTDELLKIRKSGRLLIEQYVNDILGRNHQIPFRLEGPRFSQNLPEDLITDRVRCFLRPSTLARRAGLTHLAFKTFTRAFSRDLYQPENRHVGNMAAGPIFGQRALEGVHQLTAMFIIFHIDEINNDDSPNVSQSQLSRDRLSGLHIRLEERLLKIAFTHKSTGIDVDGGHRLRLVEH